MKTVFDNEWVSVRNFMNKRFPGAAKPCALCRRMFCTRIWYSIRTGEVRCRQCFTPEILR